MTVPSTERHVVGVLVQPLDRQPDVDVRLRDLAVLQHAPALHQRQFGVGVALLLGMEVPVDLGDRRVGAFLAIAAKPRAPMFSIQHRSAMNALSLGRNSR